MNISDIVSGHIRFEGDQNTDVDVVLKDGSKHTFYSIGQESYQYGLIDGKVHPKSDYRVFEDNKEMDDWLNSLTEMSDVYNLYDPDSQCIDFDFEMEGGKFKVLKNFEVQEDEEVTKLKVVYLY